jgi:hypothetical protein
VAVVLPEEGDREDELGALGLDDVAAAVGVRGAGDAGEAALARRGRRDVLQLERRIRANLHAADSLVLYFRRSRILT